MREVSAADGITRRPTSTTTGPTCRQLLSRKRARLVAAQSELEAVEREFYRADAEHTARTHTLERYDGWASTQDRLVRLAAARSALGGAAIGRAAVRKLSEEIEHIEVPPAGELLRLRKRFHRTMLVGWLVAIVLASDRGAGRARPLEIPMIVWHRTVGGS